MYVIFVCLFFRSSFSIEKQLQKRRRTIREKKGMHGPFLTVFRKRFFKSTPALLAVKYANSLCEFFGKNVNFYILKDHLIYLRNEHHPQQQQRKIIWIFECKCSVMWFTLNFLLFLFWRCPLFNVHLMQKKREKERKKGSTPMDFLYFNFMSLDRILCVCVSVASSWSLLHVCTVN